MANFADDVGLTEEIPSDTEDKLDALLSGENTPTEEPDEPAVEVEETPALPVVEGTSVAAQMVARQAGVPQQLVESARDDSQLREYIGMASQEVSRPPPPEPEFEITLTEDDADDAVRQQFGKVKDHYSGQIATLKQDISTLVGIVKGVEGGQRSLVEQQEATKQAIFDRELDNLGDETYGGPGEKTPRQIRQRSAAYDTMEEIRLENTGVSATELARLAAFANTPNLKDKNKAANQRKSIQAQNRRILGTGNSKAAPDPDLTPTQSFYDRLSKYGLNAD